MKLMLVNAITTALAMVDLLNNTSFVVPEKIRRLLIEARQEAEKIDV